MHKWKNVEIEVWIDESIRPSMRASFRLRGEDNEDGYDEGGWSWYGAACDLVRWLREGGATMDIAYMARLSWDRLETWRHEERQHGDPAMKGYRSSDFPFELGQKLADAIEFGALLAALGFREDRYRRPVDITGPVKAIAGKYGFGRGAVRVEYTMPEVEQAISAWRARCAEFREMFDRITTIAQNRTRSVDDTEVARFSFDGADRGSFLWSAGAFRIGGLINHGTEEEPSWSIHT